MTDTQIIQEAYEEILKQMYKEFYVDENETQFIVRIQRLKRLKEKAISLLNGQ
jgi:hypothetical protein